MDACRTERDNVKKQAKLKPKAKSKKKCKTLTTSKLCLASWTPSEVPNQCLANVTASYAQEPDPCKSPCPKKPKKRQTCENPCVTTEPEAEPEPPARPRRIPEPEVPATKTPSLSEFELSSPSVSRSEAGSVLQSSESSESPESSEPEEPQKPRGRTKKRKSRRPSIKKVPPKRRVSVQKKRISKPPIVRKKKVDWPKEIEQEHEDRRKHSISIDITDRKDDDIPPPQPRVEREEPFVDYENISLDDIPLYENIPPPRPRVQKKYEPVKEYKKEPSYEEIPPPQPRVQRKDDEPVREYKKIPSLEKIPPPQPRVQRKYEEPVKEYKPPPKPRIIQTKYEEPVREPPKEPSRICKRRVTCPCPCLCPCPSVCPCWPQCPPGRCRVPFKLVFCLSRTGSYTSIRNLLRRGFQYEDRILLLTPWGCFIVFCSCHMFRKLYLLCSTCINCVDDARHMDINSGTCGLVCFKNLQRTIKYIVDVCLFRRCLRSIYKQILRELMCSCNESNDSESYC